ncbi:MAG TPA: hypothetical protein VNP92_16135 [Actinophytocola sp.]|nr:hypothetical protein [Actinophytocola sp.]
MATDPRLPAGDALRPGLRRSCSVLGVPPAASSGDALRPGAVGAVAVDLRGADGALQAAGD